jgi:hypothetical protein
MYLAAEMAIKAREKKRRPFAGPPRFLSDVEFCLEPDADAELEGARDARRERA